MKRTLRLGPSLVFVTLCSVTPAIAQEAIPNWQAPTFWSRSEGTLRTQNAGSAVGKTSEGIHPATIQTSLTPPLAFTAVTPCRQYDSRSSTPLANNTPRTVALAGAPCGIPANAGAVSVNITVFNIAGATGNGVFKVGIATPPTTAWINYPSSEAQRANAGTVATNGSGQIVVQVNQGGGQVDFTIDVNGYYADGVVRTLNGLANDVVLAPGPNINVSPMGQTLVISAPGQLLPSGTTNQTLRHNGSSWVANDGLTSDGVNVNVGGTLTLPSQFLATANGTPWFHNTGINCTFLGPNAGNLTGGAYNIGIGEGALSSIGSIFTQSNTAVGFHALGSDNSGGGNVAIGTTALANNTTGGGNIGIGFDGGVNLTTGDGNICIGAGGVADESLTIRIGTTQTRTFVAGIRGATTGQNNAIPVMVDLVGQLGTTSSSARVKDEIRDMGEWSSALLNLRPVTFRYKGKPDGSRPLHFGLIAEEVEETLPELVAHAVTGEPETVLYHEMPAMLLNELQKQQKRIEALEARLAALEAERQRGEVKGR